MELLFNHQKKIQLELASLSKDATLKELIAYLADNKLQERRDLFVQGETVYFYEYVK